MSDAYIEQRDGLYTVAGTRVSLDSIAYAFLAGQSAEAIAQAFPVLNLEQVRRPHTMVTDFARRFPRRPRRARASGSCRPAST